jgi:hypothetical protein
MSEQLSTEEVVREVYSRMDSELSPEDPRRPDFVVGVAARFFRDGHFGEAAALIRAELDPPEGRLYEILMDYADRFGHEPDTVFWSVWGLPTLFD